MVLAEEAAPVLLIAVVLRWPFLPAVALLGVLFGGSLRLAWTGPPPSATTCRNSPPERA